MFSNELTCKILDYIHDNINKEITIDELSNRFYFDKTYIMKKFKKETKLSIHEYINSIRIYNSLIYFRDDNYVLSIAFKNGFNSLEYFSETFKKIIGVSPTIYKKYITYQKIEKSEEDLILQNINRLTNIKHSMLDYLRHRKPTTPTVKSLF